MKLFQVFCYLAPFIWLSDASSNEHFVKLGCNFRNRGYEITYFPSPVPVWGRALISATQFESEEDLKSFLSKVQTIIEDVVESVHTNNVAIFKEFYNDVRGDNKRPLSASFFGAYRPKFRPLESYESQVIEVLHRIERETNQTYPTIGNSMFLSASKKPIGTICVERLMDLVGKDIPNFEYFNHVVGTIRISIGSTDRRFGYVLIETSEELNVKPVVVMEDGKPPQRVLTPNKKEHLRYVFLENKNHIVAMPKKAGITLLSSYNYWIYVAMPYCSMLETTSKYDLLTPCKGISKRDRDGVVQASIFFSVKAKCEHVCPYEYWNTSRPLFILSLNEGSSGVRHFPISFSQTNNLKEGRTNVGRSGISTEAMEAFEKVRQKLGYEKNAFIQELEEIGTILNDEPFIETLRKQSLPLDELKCIKPGVIKKMGKKMIRKMGFDLREKMMSKKTVEKKQKKRERHSMYVTQFADDK